MALLEIDDMEIPDGAVPDQGLLVVGYILPDGGNGYCIRNIGGGYVTGNLGLLEIAKIELLRSIIYSPPETLGDDD